MPWKCSRTALKVCSKRALLSALISLIKLLKLLLGAGQIGDLRGEELLALFQFILLADGFEIDVAQALDFLAKLA